MKPRTALRAVSQKRQAQNTDYKIMLEDLLARAGYHCEWCGWSGRLWYDEFGNIKTDLQIHHIDNRYGKRLINPFNAIILHEDEHERFQHKNNWEVRQALLMWVRGLRLEQGFIEEGK
jgi:hypothetical protein